MSTAQQMYDAHVNANKPQQTIQAPAPTPSTPDPSFLQFLIQALKQGTLDPDPPEHELMQMDKPRMEYRNPNPPKIRRDLIIPPANHNQNEIIDQLRNTSFKRM